MIYNFRIDRSSISEILRRLRDDGLLSQGWGGGSKDLSLTRPDFVDATKAAYALTSTRRATNLKRMTQFKDGDLIVTPHVPANGQVSIHIVDGDFPLCYDYLPGDERDLNHRIRVRESVGLDGNISMRNVQLGAWYSKLPWLRLAVLAVPEFEENFRQLHRDLRDHPDKALETSKLTEFLDALAVKVARLVHGELELMPPSAGDCSFEALCTHLLREQGYTIVRGNYYDGHGGDADIVCQRSRSDASPFEEGQVSLYVQVKRHSGTTHEAAVAQVVQMMKKDDADGCVISLADVYSDSAQKLAGDAGVRLIDGPDLSLLVLRHIANRPLASADI